ncbi:hypothetical protein D5R81_12740 [Parashewanella spongiae]|uniref:Uncharacterized protein n=1 Tax=Parashewanella spongiae TaxID=342950 RepID=A0A3A6TAJ5_9GAMM|nr:SIR2 family protein [Parashewanella spongiae]MCL1078803.1 SIR2 family protein [Parashewanella spongiae]RJY11943.1 hypothetical protein D5R81_12740 [Parashewanella spongiae]
MKILKMNSDQDNLNKLAEIFDQDTVLFIGSGVSAQANLPSWKELVEWLTDYTSTSGGNVKTASSFIGKGDLIKAATALTDELNKTNKSLPDFFTNYKKCSIFKSAAPQKIHQLISKLPTRALITPNYDLLLEQTFNSHIQVVHRSNIDVLNDIKHGRLRNFIYKYHGCITCPESIILNYEHYNRATHSNKIDFEALKCLLQTKTFVFIGAGLNDPDLNYIQEYLTEVLGTNSLNIWAFMKNCTDEVQFYREHCGVNLINYTGDSENPKDHSDLLNQLEFLVKKVKEHHSLDSRSLGSDIQNTPSDTTNLVRQTLVTANEKIIPVDEQILGFVSFFDNVKKEDCIEYATGFKRFERSDVNNRIEYLINQQLLKSTNHFLLSSRNELTQEAAKLVEDDIIMFLGEYENG